MSFGISGPLAMAAAPDDGREGTLPGRLLLALGSLLATVFVLELVLRLFMPEIGWRQFRDPALGWASKEFLRFYPFYPPTEGTAPAPLRLLFLGDSYLAGAGVRSLDQRFPSRLDALLGDEVEVEILATGGWGTDQQLLAFVQKGAVWRPDRVVLAFCANNDLANILSNGAPLERRKPYFRLEDDGDLVLYDGQGRALEADPRTRWVAQSYLVDFLRQRLASSSAKTQSDVGEADPRYLRFDPFGRRYEDIRALSPRLEWSPQDGINHVSAYIHEDFADNSYQWSLLRALLERLQGEVERAGAELVVMLLPVSLDPGDPRFIAGGSLEFEFDTPTGPFTFRAAEPRDRLERITDELGIEFYDSTPRFLRAMEAPGALARAWPNPEDRHFSAYAHELLARSLARWVARGPRLPDRRRP